MLIAILLIVAVLAVVAIRHHVTLAEVKARLAATEQAILTDARIAVDAAKAKL